MEKNVVRDQIANVINRRTVHHVFNDNGKAVAIRLGSTEGTFDLTYSDGVTHRGLAQLVAEELAETFLGIEPRRPLKRHSIPLGSGWSISLRRDEVWPEDPGNGCPAMVCGPFGVSSTYWCAQGEGYVSGRNGDVEIPSHVYRKLDRAEGEVATYLHDCNRWFAANPR